MIYDILVAVKYVVAIAVVVVGLLFYWLNRRPMD